MFHLLGYMIVGLIAGALAKAIMPGDKNEPKGCLLTMLLGTAGAIVMGFLVHTILHEPNHFGFSGFVRSIIGATIGAILLLWLYGMSQNKRPVA